MTRAGHVDIVKIFLLDATEQPPVMPDTGLPSGHGLRSSLAPEIVRAAHADLSRRVAPNTLVSMSFGAGMRLARNHA